MHNFSGAKEIFRLCPQEDTHASVTQHDEKEHSGNREQKEWKIEISSSPLLLCKRKAHFGWARFNGIIDKLAKILAIRNLSVANVVVSYPTKGECKKKFNFVLHSRNALA